MGLSLVSSSPRATLRNYMNGTRLGFQIQAADVEVELDKRTCFASLQLYLRVREKRMPKKTLPPTSYSSSSIFSMRNPCGRPCVNLYKTPWTGNQAMSFMPKFSRLQALDHVIQIILSQDGLLARSLVTSLWEL